jgi:multimeric flavodoxin WrbA
MKIVGICCSPRKGRTTFQAMEACLASAYEVDDTIETVLVELADKKIGPCIACNICKQGLICGIDDDFGELLTLLSGEDVAGVIVGTPVYVGSMTAQCKAFLDRSVVLRRNDWLLRDTVGGALAVGGVRHGGQELTLQAVRAAMLCHDMICVGDGRPSGHFGAALYSGGPDGIETDEDGLATARHLGRRVAEVALKLRATSSL